MGSKTFNSIMSETKNICFLNSNDQSGILAYGSGGLLELNGTHVLEAIHEFINEHKGKYLFMALSYDIKNEIEDLNSQNPDSIQFPKAVLWCPEVVVKIKDEKFSFVQGEETELNKQVLHEFLEENSVQSDKKSSYKFVPRISKDSYINTVNKIKEHIQRGDIYELNYCQEFNSYNIDLQLNKDTYFKLNNITKAPFSSYFHFGDIDVFCGSPERFIKLENNRLTAQPIKGTIKRGTTEQEDEQYRKQLEQDPKERAENIMIVDLMRNDLSKIAQKDSVQVEELCGIYSFETVHQMISTVSCKPCEVNSFIDIIKATFPMGSMTGAPKIRAMELIEEYEDFKRGLYSGSIGYIAPNGDFDFNVIIRTVIYNRRLKTLSCAVGSAITIQSDAEREYEECLVKIQKILDAFQ